MFGTLQSANFSDLDNGDIVEFECSHCHYSILVRPLMLRALRGKKFIPDDMKVLDLRLRWTCKSCGLRSSDNRVRVLSAGPARVRR